MRGLSYAVTTNPSNPTPKLAQLIPMVDDYYRHFREVRAYCRKFEHYSLINRLLDYITKPQLPLEKQAMLHPWWGLLLIKWIIQDDRFPNARKERATLSDAKNCMAKIQSLQGFVDTKISITNLHMFMRMAIFLQHPFQQHLSGPKIARQCLLFANLEPNSWISRTFEERAGMPLEAFCDMALLMGTAHLSKPQRTIPMSFFKRLKDDQLGQYTDSLFNLLSLDIQALKTELRASVPNPRPYNEIYEHSPFFKTPLIKTNQGFVVMHSACLFRCLEDFIYDYLKNINANRFMNQFGGLFEQYVTHSIRNSGASVIVEKDIKAELGAETKKVDFIIQENGLNIYVDAKAVEMDSSAKMTQSFSSLKSRTKRSILKAIAQSHATANEAFKQEKFGIQDTDESYILVVTYKNMNLFNGRFYCENIVPGEMDALYAAHQEGTIISPDRIYFVDITEFDLMCELVRSKQTTFGEILVQARVADSEVGTSKFNAELHLSAIFKKLDQPQWLQSTMDERFAKVLDSVIR